MLKGRSKLEHRTHKEYLSYQKEAEKEKAKVQKMEEDKKDEADIKHQKQVLEETLAMIPDTKTRLEKVVADLTELIVILQRIFRKAYLRIPQLKNWSNSRQPKIC